MQNSDEQFGSKGVARRVRPNATPAPNIMVMVAVVCPDCGMRFEIGHRANCPDRSLAHRQAVWLADKFVWDHIQENKHPSTIHLPTANELTTSN